jgi:hypothetical protein
MVFSLTLFKKYKNLFYYQKKRIDISLVNNFSDINSYYKRTTFYCFNSIINRIDTSLVNNFSDINNYNKRTTFYRFNSILNRSKKRTKYCRFFSTKNSNSNTSELKIFKKKFYCLPHYKDDSNDILFHALDYTYADCKDVFFHYHIHLQTKSTPLTGVLDIER